LQGVKQQITERSLGEQVQRLREQNERTRLSLDADLVDRLDERFSSERLLDRRRWVAEYIKENKENFILDGDLQEVRHFNYANPEGGEPPYHRIGELYSKDVEQMQTSLSSDEGRAVSADFQSFATGGVPLLISEIDV
jgi:hypothetical protein